MILDHSTAAFAHFLIILTIGIFPFFWRHKKDFSDPLLAFGAGVLLSAAFLHMLPSSISEIGERSGVFVLCGFVLMVLIDRFTMAHPCGEESCPTHRIGMVAFLGLSIHSIISGIALGISLLKPDSVNIALLAAILIHKIPETLALMTLLKSSGYKKDRLFSFLFMFACMGPAGILLGKHASLDNKNLLGVALAVSTGTFIYIAASDLLPYLHKKLRQKWFNLVAFLLGLLMLSFEAVHHFIDK